MNLPLYLVVAIAVLSGLSYALIAVAYQLGGQRGIPPTHILTLAATLGAVLFCTLAMTVGGGAVSPWIAGFGFLTGVLQYLLAQLLKPAMKRGPMAPLWCALQLGFIPAIFFSWIFLGEERNIWQVIATALAVMAVFAAAASAHDDPQADRAAKKRQLLVYAGLLLLILLVNSEAGMANKWLQHRIPEFMQQVNVYLGTLYLGIAVPGWFGVLKSKKRSSGRRAFLLLGAMAGVGTIGGLYLQNRIIEYPAALIFTVINSSSILFSAVLGVLICGEKRSFAWYLSLGFALAAILASQGQVIFGKQPS